MRGVLTVGLVMLAACGAPSTSAVDGGNVLDAGATADGGTAALNIEASWITSPLKRLDNGLEVHLTDATGEHVEGANVNIALYMPAHGHGAPAPTVEEHEHGEYHSHAVNFTMAGTWEITVTATKGELTASHVLTAVIP
ncbi:MAG: FixH family protein [Archangium sp.]|nr:FixH family protein [Archangium sp.]